MNGLTARWTDLRRIDEQLRYVNSPHRFNVVPAGRRSGKTELAKRKLALRAMLPQGAPGGSVFPDPHYFCAAPTRDQAKRIYWNDMKRLIPRELIRRNGTSETELTITTAMNSTISIVGMDKPERIEGSPWDGGILDEYGNMKAHAWGANVRPALADRNGWCDLIGVPEGRNHYYEMSEKAKASMLERGRLSEWGFFHWKSSLILPESEIRAARENLDQLTFEQEYEGSFINFHGRAYYAYTDANKAALEIDPTADLKFCFDFNVEPGVAAVCQEGLLPNGLVGTKVVGEVWIPQNSNTVAVCKRLVQDWLLPQYTGDVYVYGDATGGNRGTAKVAGSDWDLVREVLLPAWGERLKIRVGRTNPAERARINSVNSRCCSATGDRRLFVDLRKAEFVSRDLDGVRLLEGGSGELDKSGDKRLTHISDALGYYISYEFMAGQGLAIARTIFG